MPTLGNMTATKTLLVTDNGPAIVDTAPEHAGEGDTLIRVSHSSVNYKDGMALAGNKGVVRTLPIVPGICLLYTSPSPRDISGSRMPSSA